jgi:phage anti-repressor protein
MVNDTQKRFDRYTLKRSYKVNIDYTITKYNTNKPGSNNYKKTMLTIDCFKRLCMRSRSLKAEEVRSYFIELDDFIAHYSDQIYDGIIRDIEKVAKRVNKNPNTDGPGYIYAIRAFTSAHDMA